MVVRIRLGRGSAVSRRKGKNGRIDVLGASLLTMASICLGTLGVWRVSQDLGWTGGFVFEEGLLSHWQVWMGAAAVIQYGSWRLTRYARGVREIQAAAAAPEPASSRARAAANL